MGLRDFHFLKFHILIINRPPFERHYFKRLSLACKSLHDVSSLFICFCSFPYVKVGLAVVVHALFPKSYVDHPSPSLCGYRGSAGVRWPHALLPSHFFSFPPRPNLDFPLRYYSLLFYELFPHHFKQFEVFPLYDPKHSFSLSAFLALSNFVLM